MSHQIDESAYRGVLPEDMEWKPFSAFPPSARLAVVVGDPTAPARTCQSQAACWGQADAARTPGGSRRHGDLAEADVEDTRWRLRQPARTRRSVRRGCPLVVPDRRLSYPRDHPYRRSDLNYNADPVEAPADGSALICCSQPSDDVVLDL